MSRHSALVVLVSVHDGAALLPGWLESTAAFADAVVALDHGSGDGSAEILARDPLVHRVLAGAGGPSGLGYNRLLRAARDLDPAWALILSVDERLPADEAAALRSFLERDAIAGVAYGLRLMRTDAGGARYDLAGPVVFRLFAYGADLRLPADASPIALVPTVIPPHRWVPTNLRVATTVGPAGAVPDGWTDVEGVPGELRPWAVRAEGAALTSAGRPEARDAEAGPEVGLGGPVLSVVIDGQDWPSVEETLRSVLDQEVADPFEVVMVLPESSHPPDVAAGASVVAVTPDLPGPARRRAGFGVAKGEYVLFLPGGAVLLPGCLEALIRAHDGGHPVVAGTVLNGTASRLGWASYFLTRSAVLAGRDRLDLSAAPSGCSLDRSRLDEWAVVDGSGLGARRAPESRRIEPAATTARGLLRERYRWGLEIGRASTLDLWVPFAAARVKSRLAWMLRFGPEQLERVDTNVSHWGEGLVPVYRRARPWVVAGTAASWVGAIAGSMGRSPSGSRRTRRSRRG